MTTELEPDNSVVVYVKKHKVIVIGGTIVHIHHIKTCKKPCNINDEIIYYLKAELFIDKRHIVADMYE